MGSSNSKQKIEQIFNNKIALQSELQSLISEETNCENNIIAAINNASSTDVSMVNNRKMTGSVINIGKGATVEGSQKINGTITIKQNNITSYIGSRSDVIIPAYVKVTIGDMQITAIVKVACATDSTSFFGDKANNITSLKFGASVDPDNTTVKCNGLSKVLTGLSNLTTLDLNRLEITDGSEDLSNVFNDCGALKNIKMPKTLKNTTTLNATGLKGLENWYYVASGSASLGQNVIGTNAISVYANNILSTDGSKTYEQLNKVFSGEADSPSTPSTGVVVDVILPVASITLVLANVCALAFAGKKKKQF